MGTVVLSVKRSKAELVAPCKPTPGGIKHLSDIDNQLFLRCQLPVLLLYPTGAGGKKTSGKEEEGGVGKVIKDALGKVLVYYYPWAGRMVEVEGPDGEEKLAVDCTAEGVVFVEAEADFTLAELGGREGFFRPPFPCSEELVPPSSDFLHSPLLHFQVTKLMCGGFVFAVRLNHAMTDAIGILQFLNAIAEIARGASHPSVMPVWSRHILCFPRVAPMADQSDSEESNPIIYDPDDDENNKKEVNYIHRTFFFGHEELSIIRQRLHPRLRSTSTNFELLAAFLWQCRISALRLHSLQNVSLIMTVNVRPMLNLPDGFYGNAIVFGTSVSHAGKITASLDYAVDLVKRAKANVTPDFIKSVPSGTGSIPTHFMITAANSWSISDNKRFKFLEVDFGWGKPVYGGAASDLMDGQLIPLSFFTDGKNNMGRSGLLVPICLPDAAMDRLAQLVDFSPRPKI